ncbi:MAG: carboxypeptidase-like regulatory domain-containing protein [Terriglobales bacterium]
MRVHALILICILGVLCISAKGQAAGGPVHSTSDSKISGKVTDLHGKVAPGAIVTLRDVVTEEKTTATADKHGKYLFASVFPGEYSLSASFKNKESDSQSISLGHREKLQKDLKIKND